MPTGLRRKLKQRSQVKRLVAILTDRALKMYARLNLHGLIEVW